MGLELGVVPRSALPSEGDGAGKKYESMASGNSAMDLADRDDEGERSVLPQRGNAGTKIHVNGGEKKIEALTNGVV